MTKRILDADALLLRIKNSSFLKDKSNMDTMQACREIGFKSALDYVIDSINELATPAEPQESIFDADGWCWDMDLAPDSENVIFYITNFNLKTKRAATGKRINKHFYFSMESGKDEPVAWQPLPKLPTGGKE